MRSAFKLLAGLIIILAVAWLGAWWYAEYRLQALLIASVQQAEGNGTAEFSYSSVTRGTSPLTASASLNNVQIALRTRTSVAPIMITLPSFGMHLDVIHPLLVRFDIPQQIGIGTTRGQLAITFGNITSFGQLAPDAVFGHSNQPFTGGELSASNINVLASSGSIQVLHIDQISGQTKLNNSAGANQVAINETEEVDGLSLSPILVRIASVPFDGQVKHIALGLAISGPLPNGQSFQDKLNALPPGSASRQKLIAQASHDWALAGGSGDASLSLAIGPSTLEASGDVKFGSNAQPSGLLNVAADHLDSFSAALTGAYPQLQGIVNGTEARLSPYLSITGGDGQVLSMHVNYGNGSVSINGNKVADLPLIDWDTLINPPTPPPQAPGDGSGAASGQ